MRRRVALALLAVANLKPNTPWEKASTWEGEGSWSLTTREIIGFWNKHYEENVSSGSYDDVRRRDLKYLTIAGIVSPSVADPSASTNDPTRRYAIVPEARELLRSFGKESWKEAVENVRTNLGVLKDKMEREHALQQIPVKLPEGQELNLSPGQHNELQKAIIEQLLPRYAPGADILYVGDAHKKSLVLNEGKLKELGFFELAHDILPDVVAYDSKKNWIFLVEAVHSANPMNKLRHIELEKMTNSCKAPRIYISVFKDRDSFRDHMIHFNGPKFLGPYSNSS